MRYAEYFLFFFASVASFFLAKAVIRKSWPRLVKVFFRYGVPLLVFILLAFYFVFTGERVEDRIAKALFCWAYSFEACSRSDPRPEIAGRQPAPPVPAVQTTSPAEHFELRNISSIAVTRVNCIEASKQADKYFHANNRVRMQELLEITLSICSQTPNKDQQVKEHLAGAYVALASQLGRGSPTACRYYAEARQLFSEISQPLQATQVDFMRKVDNCS